MYPLLLVRSCGCCGPRQEREATAESIRNQVPCQQEISKIQAKIRITCASHHVIDSRTLSSSCSAALFIHRPFTHRHLYKGPLAFVHQTPPAGGLLDHRFDSRYRKHHLLKFDSFGKVESKWK